MKRTLLALLMILVATTSAEAATKKKVRKAKPKKVEHFLKTESGAIPAIYIEPEKKQAGPGGVVTRPGPLPSPPPVESQLKRGASRRFDLRSLPQTKPVEHERVELEPPDHTPITVESNVLPQPSFPVVPGPSAPAPAPNAVYEGLDRFNFGAGSPPDTNGDAGPTYYIQTVNTSVGIFRKSDGTRVTAFSFNKIGRASCRERV